MADQPRNSIPPESAVPPIEDGTSATRVACPYCLDAIADGAAMHTCPSCRAVYHAECWEENGGCGVYGCARAPAVENRRAIDVPISYWGQENKPCPSCGQEILAAAVRCRHCGTTFASAKPQGVAEFQVQSAINERLPDARRQCITIFVLSVVPVTAPIGAIWGLVWGSKSARELGALPPLYSAFHRIGLIASLTISVATAVLTILYVAVRGS